MNGGDWIDRVAKIILQLGLPTVFAVVLLWFVLTKMDAAVAHVAREMARQTEHLVEIQNHIIERDRSLFKYEWRQEHRRPPRRDNGDD